MKNLILQFIYMQFIIEKLEQVVAIDSSYGASESKPSNLSSAPAVMHFNQSAFPNSCWEVDYVHSITPVDKDCKEGCHWQSPLA